MRSRTLALLGCHDVNATRHLGHFLLLHFGHLTFAASCSVMVSVRSNDLPHLDNDTGRSARLSSTLPIKCFQ